MTTKQAQQYFVHYRCKKMVRVRVRFTVMASRYWVASYILRLIDSHFSLVYFIGLKYILGYWNRPKWNSSTIPHKGMIIALLLLIGQQYLQDLSNVIDGHDFSCEPVSQPPPGCYTPPDSVASQTDSPHGMQVEPAVIDYSRNNTNFDCSPIIASNPGPLPPPLSGLQNGAAPTGSATELPQSTALGAAVSSVQPTGSLGNAMTGQHRPQVTSSRCSRAVIEIVNPREEYDKIQKKHGHRGKYSEQRITNGMVWFRYNSIAFFVHFIHLHGLDFLCPYQLSGYRLRIFREML